MEEKGSDLLVAQGRDGETMRLARKVRGSPRRSVKGETGEAEETVEK